MSVETADLAAIVDKMVAPQPTPPKGWPDKPKKELVDIIRKTKQNARFSDYVFVYGKYTCLLCGWRSPTIVPLPETAVCRHCGKESKFVQGGYSVLQINPRNNAYDLRTYITSRIQENLPPAQIFAQDLNAQMEEERELQEFSEETRLKLAAYIHSKAWWVLIATSPEPAAALRFYYRIMFNQGLEPELIEASVTFAKVQLVAPVTLLLINKGKTTPENLAVELAPWGVMAGHLKEGTDILPLLAPKEDPRFAMKVLTTIITPPPSATPPSKEGSDEDQHQPTGSNHAEGNATVEMEGQESQTPG